MMWLITVSLAMRPPITQSKCTQSCLAFTPTLQQGGVKSRGNGEGLNSRLYPFSCHVTAESEPQRIVGRTRNAPITHEI